MRDNRVLWAILGLALLVLAAVAVYKAWPVLFPRAQLTLDIDPDCDLRAGPCGTQTPGGGKVSFSIEPRSIPVIQPLQLQVVTEQMKVSSVEVDFSGVDMYMGFNRVKLKAMGNGRFVGEGRIPVCVRDAMEWDAKVLMTTDRGLVTAPFRFITVKAGILLPQ